MKLLDQYIALRDDVFAYFGYVEDWRVLLLDDARQYFWKLDGEGHRHCIAIGSSWAFAVEKYPLNAEIISRQAEDEIIGILKWIYEKILTLNYTPNIRAPVERRVIFIFRRALTSNMLRV